MNEQSNNTRLGDVAYVVRSVEGATAIARGNITNSKIETVDEIHNRLMAYDDIKRERDELREALKKCREDSICYAEHMRRCGYAEAYKESNENADRATRILEEVK
jgi:hypothetical protein